MARTPAAGTTLYSYLLNNYWHTNYKADQEGTLRFRYVLSPHGPFDPVALRRFSDDQTQPLLAVSVTAAAPPMTAPFTLESSTVLVSSLKSVDGGNGLLIRLYNPGAVAATAMVKPASPDARLVDVDSEGNPRQAITGP